MNKQAYERIVGLVLTKQANPTIPSEVVPAPMPEIEVDPSRTDPGFEYDPNKPFTHGKVYKGSEINESNDPSWAFKRHIPGETYTKLDPNKYYRFNAPGAPGNTALEQAPSWELVNPLPYKATAGSSTAVAPKVQGSSASGWGAAALDRFKGIKSSGWGKSILPKL